VAPWITVLSRHTLFPKRVIYKFTLVWYSSTQGTMHRPTSDLVHLSIVPFLWPWEEHRQQQCCQNHISQPGKMKTYVKCLHIYIYIYRCLWRGLGGGRGTFWLLTFKGPEALQATEVNRIGVNKIPPKSDTQFATYIYKLFGYLKGSLHDIYIYIYIYVCMCGSVLKG